MPQVPYVPPTPVLHWDWPPLSDDAWVIRGGINYDGQYLYERALIVRKSSAQGSYPGTWGLCVGAAEDLSPEFIALDWPYRGPWYTEARMAVVRQHGFDVVMCDEPPHAVLTLEDEPDGPNWEGWDRLRAVFSGPPRPNP